MNMHSSLFICFSHTKVSEEENNKFCQRTLCKCVCAPACVISSANGPVNVNRKDKALRSIFHKAEPC